MLRSVIIVIGLIIHLGANAQDVQPKLNHDLSFLSGEWLMSMTYSPESDNPRTLKGNMICQWAMDSSFIKCEYQLKREGRKDALNDVYFNYNQISDQYESMWMSSTWPVKVLLKGDLEKGEDSIRLTTFAEFPIENGLTEFVKDKLVIAKGSDNFYRKTYIRTSEENEWRFHSLEKATRTTVERLANQDQISGKTWQALGPGFTNTVLETSQIYISDQLAAQYKIEKPVVQNLLRYTLSYTQDQLSSNKVIYRYPHYNQTAIDGDLQQLANAELLEQNDSLFSITAKGNQILTSYWNLRRNQVRFYDYLSSEQLQTLYNVIHKVVSRARNLDSSYPNESVKARFLSRSKNFEDEHLAIKVSELLKEYTAFINDVSHYKYQMFPKHTKNEPWKNLKLSALASELMSATRNGRVYDVSRCYNQSYWRQGQARCDEVINELIEAGLVIKQNESIKQTSPGADLSKAAEAFADLRRYKAWQDVSIPDYLEFIEILDWILENPVESFVPYPERPRRLIQSIGFSPNQDTMYFALPHKEYLESQGETVNDQTPRLAIYYATKLDEGWGEPQLIDFGDFGGTNAYEPTLSSDGQLMIFNSPRQFDGSPVKDRDPNNLWFSEKKNGKWQQPKYLQNINSKDLEESYSTITKDGELIYLQQSKINGESAFTLLSTQFKGEKTKKGKPTGLGYAIGDPWIARDGSYIIYTKFDPKDWANTCDLHYSFRDGKGWTEPKKMPKINGKRSDYAVAITPDEQWLYYRRRGRFLKFPFQPILNEMRENR